MAVGNSYERIVYEAVDGPAVEIAGVVFDRPFMLKIVQQSASFGRVLFRPMTVIRHCSFEAVIGHSILLVSI